jgi:hypothetical protein
MNIEQGDKNQKTCYWGRYAPLRDESGYLGSKVGGKSLAHVEPPLCKGCGKPMFQAAQVRLDEPAQMSARYQLAQLFYCQDPVESENGTECEVWEADWGANAVILSRLPEVVELGPGYEVFPNSITWQQGPEPPYYDGEGVVSDADYELAESISEAWPSDAKFGGMPDWVQSEEWPSCPSCGGNTKFVASLDAGLLPEQGTSVVWLDVWSDGRAYLFICENECGPRGAATLYQNT